MNLWEKHPLAQQHQIGLLDERSAPYWLRVQENRVSSLKVAERITQLNHTPIGQSPFPDGDLIPKRVGVTPQKPMGDGSIDYFPISWAEYSVLRNPEFRATLEPNEIFYCLSVCGVIKTIDEQLILSVRSKNVSIYQGYLHVSAAGFVDLKSAVSAQNVQFQFFNEIEEELGLLPSDLINMKQLGLCQHLVADSASIEVCMYGETNLAASAVLSRAAGAKDNWEGKIHAFPVDKVIEMLRDTKSKFNPGGAATLILALKL